MLVRHREGVTKSAKVASDRVKKKVELVSVGLWVEGEVSGHLVASRSRQC